MSQETKTLTPDEQKELKTHFKNLLAAKRFLDSKGLSAYYMRDVIVDVLTHAEKYNII